VTLHRSISDKTGRTNVLWCTLIAFAWYGANSLLLYVESLPTSRLLWFVLIPSVVGVVVAIAAKGHMLIKLSSAGLVWLISTVLYLLTASTDADWEVGGGYLAIVAFAQLPAYLGAVVGSYYFLRMLSADA